MSLKNGEMHALSGVVTSALTAAFVAGIMYFQTITPDEVCDDEAALDEDKDGLVNCADDDCKELPLCQDNRLVIDAQLAYKKEDEQKQPQKELKPKEQKVDEGVSRDETKSPDVKSCTSDKDCSPKEECINDVCQRRKNETADTSPTGVIPDRTNVDDLPSGSATPEVGAFDGSKYGSGPVNKGDPYFGGLAAILKQVFQPPEIAKTDGAPPRGCIRMEKTGKISDTEFEVKSTDDLQPLAEKALGDLQREWNKDPQPVPTHLLKDLTTGWVCFNFTAQGITK